ncbi:hypothetical protein HS096_02715 [candidate division WWE3 bacterium]|uniref:Uncharacterized protein n=1 Tax=candidate division WWE3 bacterium TaxID=2053526 RepID=A0A928TVQ5_UNCKA|nr:hypothetical protein [candidate division WWE3 bacterium]
MDILGFLALLMAFGLAPRFGVDEAILQTLRDAKSQGRNAYERTRLLYSGLAVGPTQIMLILAVTVQMVIAAFGLAALDQTHHAWQTMSWFPIAIGTFTAAIMALELLEAFAIGAARPRYRNVPRTNAEGAFLDAAGNVVGEENQAAIVEELERYVGYRPERFRLRRCLAYAVLAFVGLGIGWGYAGIMTESRFLTALGACSFYAALAAIRAMAGFIAWAVEKGAKLLEKVATVITRQALIALPSITRENIEQHLPFGVNIIEEEAAAARIRNAATALAVFITPFAMLMTAYPHPVTAVLAGAFLFITGLAGWYLSKNGGELEVENIRYRFARAMFYGVPAVTVALLCVRHVVPLLPEGFQAFWIDQYHGLLRFGSGQTGMGFLQSWWQNLLISVLTGIMFLIVLSLAFGLRPNARNGRPGFLHRGAFYALASIAAVFLAVSLWSGAGLAANIAGKNEVRLPVVTSASSDLSPASAITSASNKKTPPADAPVKEEGKDKPKPAPEILPKRPKNTPPSRVASAEPQKDCDPVQITQDEAEFFTKFGALTP